MSRSKILPKIRCKRPSKNWHPLLLPVTVSLATLAPAQALPTATTGTPAPFAPVRSLPLIDGQFDYALNASEIVQTGYGATNGTVYSTNLSGDIVYTSKSTSRPFSAVYAGGVLIGNQSNQSTAPFQSLTLSQGFVGRGWVFSVGDTVSYLPSSPTVGLSGIPGTGDLGSQPVITGNEPAQTILTTDSARVSNTVSGQVSRQLTATTSLSGTGSYGILRFLGGYGLDNTQVLGSLSLNHEFDARDTGSISASYSVFSYPGGYSFTSRGLNAGFSRRLTRNLTAEVSAGPLWINNSASLGIPSRLTVSTDTGLTYSRNTTTAAVHVTRGVNGGSGVQPRRRLHWFPGLLPARLRPRLGPRPHPDLLLQRRTLERQHRHRDRPHLRAVSAHRLRLFLLLRRAALPALHR